MYIFKLELANFRNYSRSAIALDKGLNLFVGENAQGKSNLLEAIYVLSTLRSTFPARQPQTEAGCVLF